jgi:peptide/nickel transport system ATP-binding protein/peptide/nickel transport system permease protein
VSGANDGTRLVADTGDPRSEKRSENRVLSQMQRQRATVAAFAGIVALVFIAIVTPWIAPYDPNFANIMERHEGISWRHLMGTDGIGRDTYSRILYGARTAFWSSFESVGLALLVGVPCGLLVGYLGGWVDRVAMRATDILQSVPSLIFAFALIAVLGRGTNQTALAVAIVFSVILMRITRALTLRERELLYVDAARVAGLSRTHILFREILPNVVGPLIVESAIMLGTAILIITMLTFLGLGLDASIVDWGGMLDETRQYQAVYPYAVLPPGLAIVVAVLMFNFAGDGLRDALAGKQRSTASNKRLRAARRADHVAASPAEAPGPSDLVTVERLRVEFPGDDESVLEILSDVSFSIRRGEMLGLVGESGSGKSMTALALLGLVPPPGEVTAGKIQFGGRDLTAIPEAEMNRIRGSEISIIFQDSIAGFSPVHTIGQQLAEPLRMHRGLSDVDAMKRVIELLDLVGVPDAANRVKDYPHQFSGGMAQRASIAMALSCGPKVLVADEPTTALDVTIQAQVLDLLRDLQERFNMSVLLITHDLGVVAETCDRVLVMYAGEIVEEGDVMQILTRPRHPYTRALLAATPRNDIRLKRLPTIRGIMPAAWEWPRGCRFAPRCAHALPACTATRVPFVDGVRCIRADEIRGAGIH